MPLPSRAFSHTRRDLRVLRFARRTTEKRQTARGLTLTQPHTQSQMARNTNLNSVSLIFLTGRITHNGSEKNNSITCAQPKVLCAKTGKETVQTSVMQVQSCCFAYKTHCFFCSSRYRPRRWILSFLSIFKIHRRGRRRES